MSCSGKPSGKSGGYTPKKMMGSKSTKAPSSRGGHRASGAGDTGNFGSPKVKMSFGARGR